MTKIGGHHLFHNEYHLGLAERYAIAGENLFALRQHFTVEQSAVGAAQVFHPVSALHLQNPRMMARDVVICSDRNIVGLIAAHFAHRLREGEAIVSHFVEQEGRARTGCSGVFAGSREHLRASFAVGQIIDVATNRAPSVWSYGAPATSAFCAAGGHRSLLISVIRFVCIEVVDYYHGNIIWRSTIESLLDQLLAQALWLVNVADCIANLLISQDCWQSV